MIPDRVYVSGTDTDVGKTVTCAALCAAFGHAYWKPIQAGVPGDRETVAALAGVPTFPERWRLRRPASPHAAAAEEGVRINPESLTLPDAPRLVVEGAGGWRVPYATDPAVWTSDLVRHLRLPVIVVGRTGLGTLNHTLLTVDRVRADGCTLAGVVLVGERHPENERDVAALGQTTVLAVLPRVGLPEGFGQLVDAVRSAAVGGHG